MQYQALAVKQVKKYKLQHTNAFVSYNRENECLFGCKLSRTTYSMKEDKLLMNRVGMTPIAKSVLKYINITSIAYLHCLLRFCQVWFCWFQNSWVAWVGSGLIRVCSIHMM